MDGDGYPTDEELQEIENWNPGDFKGLMEFIEDLWIYPDYFTAKTKDKMTTYNISTGGWSGHESVIGTMKQNTIFWMICWVQSRRGGHYIFEVKEKQND